jgi:TRAP-type mannitol/chloroaromatic compound transport system permease small subunit
MAALPETSMSRRIDAFVHRIGDALSWIWGVLLLVIVVNVTLRYVFGRGFIELEELQWHLYAVGFLVGLSYCCVSDTHVRVDVLRERLPVRHQAWLEFYGILLLLVPFIALIVIFGVPFALEAWRSGEVSQAPGGLPHRFVIKAALPLGFSLLALATFSRLLRISALLFTDSHDQRDA